MKNTNCSIPLSAIAVEPERVHRLLSDYVQAIDRSPTTVEEDNVEAATDDILLLLALEKQRLLPDSLRDKSQQVVHQGCSALAQHPWGGSHNYCLWAGRMRLIFTFVRAYEVYGDRQYLDYAAHFLNDDIFDYASSSSLGNSLRGGRAGLLLGMLYCQTYLQEPYLDPLIRTTLDLLVNNLQLQEKGISLFYEDRHIAPLADLSEGNAGLLWFLSAMHHAGNDSSFIPLVRSVTHHLESEWSDTIHLWKDYHKKIGSLHDHQIYTEHWQAGNLDFFYTSEQNFSFWQGNLGIVAALLRSYEGEAASGETIDRLTKTLEVLASQEGEYASEESFLVYYYLHHLTHSSKYAEQAQRIFLNSRSLQDRIKMYLHLRSERYTHYAIPSLTSPSVVEVQLSGFPVVRKLIERKYYKTIVLVNSVDATLIDQYFSKADLPLDRSLYTSFAEFITQAISSEGFAHKVPVADCLRYETANVAFVEECSNKIFLKTEEIVQYSAADELLKLPKELLLREVLQVYDKIQVDIFSWNWTQRTAEDIEKNLDVPADDYVTLTQLRTFVQETENFILTEAQLLLLEKFYDPISVRQALEEYYLDYEITSEADKAAIKSFVLDTVDYLVYNRFIVRGSSEHQEPV